MYNPSAVAVTAITCTEWPSRSPSLHATPDRMWVDGMMMPGTTGVSNCCAGLGSQDGEFVGTDGCAPAWFVAYYRHSRQT